MALLNLVIFYNYSTIKFNCQPVLNLVSRSMFNFNIEFADLQHIWTTFFFIFHSYLRNFATTYFSIKAKNLIHTQRLIISKVYSYYLQTF